MNKNMFGKLALNNIKSNRSTFLPFALCSAAMVSLFYMISSISFAIMNGNFYGGASMRLILQFGSMVCAVFSFFVLLYTNSFLMKRRAKELGLYSMLGMDKKHIGKILFWEIFDTGLASILAGLIVGMTFSKLIFLFLEKIVKMTINISYTVSAGPVLRTLILFGAVFMVSILFNFIRVMRLKPLELMKSTKMGEKEPKANWFIAVLGIVCLGIGYYIAVSTDNPLKALAMFFVAVLFVIAGTYCVFVSGMVAILKLMKKNKNFYYKKKHFVTVSGLIYRMKQNAVGLANICILSTAVLVVLFSTVALYWGTEKTLKQNYPEDVNVIAYKYVGESSDTDYSDYQVSDFEDSVNAAARDYGVTLKNVRNGFSCIFIGKLEENVFVPVEYYGGDISMVTVKTVEEYNQVTGENISLKDHEILFHSSTGTVLKDQTFIVGQENYKLVGADDKRAAKLEEVGILTAANIAKEYITIIVDNPETMEKMYVAGIEGNLTNSDALMYTYGFDIEGDEENKLLFADKLRRNYLEKNDNIKHLASVNSIYTARNDYYALYGTLFFIGIFIGLMFLVTTVMIIYYKQISEGHEDREKFTIMRKVGMSDREIKATIRSQILMVFFMPLIIALVHICFAFPVIRKIMMVFGLLDVKLLIASLLLTVLIYMIFYAIVYALTAKSYYKCLMCDTMS